MRVLLKWTENEKKIALSVLDFLKQMSLLIVL